MPDLPPGTPPAARELMERLHAIPFARKEEGSRHAGGRTRGMPLASQLLAVFNDIAAGTRGESGRPPDERIRQFLTQTVHESNDPSFRIWELADAFDPVTDAQGRRRMSPLAQALRDWERRVAAEGKA